MFEKVRDGLNKVIDIADKCPEKYQVKCFEILLDALVKWEISGTAAVVGATGVYAPRKPKLEFFSTYNISEEEWTRVLHFDGTTYSITVKDLKDKAKTKKQVKLALLLGVKGILETGNPRIEKDTLINMCRDYGAYDAGNFSGIMKKNKNLFVLENGGWTLTVPGKTAAAEVIKELAQ